MKLILSSDSHHIANICDTAFTRHQA
ncbi:hypothetical protein BDI4_580075 [Burkholderia diffusa]|nr:hypothetical protein BDI4_580075 [Burkholderia diffusa]